MLLRLAAEYRDLAKRATRLAMTLSEGADRERLKHYADELEEQASSLDGQIAALITKPDP